jgi:hypothetical protein
MFAPSHFRTATVGPRHQRSPVRQLMSPYGDRFGGDNAMPSAWALDLMASSVRPRRTLMTPTGVLPAARSRSC